MKGWIEEQEDMLKNLQRESIKVGFLWWLCDWTASHHWCARIIVGVPTSSNCVLRLQLGRDWRSEAHDSAATCYALLSYIILDNID
jgi:hypothetical protein